VAAEGIVIIDEIDLHLHPGLERVVLNRFQDVFPGIQFIISTHSPLVITSMKTDESRNRIYRMEPDSVTPTVVSDVYGLDYNSGIENVMLVYS
jgi:predicted ATP-binding protein involved in virulence